MLFSIITKRYSGNNLQMLYNVRHRVQNWEYSFFLYLLLLDNSYTIIVTWIIEFFKCFYLNINFQLILCRVLKIAFVKEFVCWKITN